MSHEKNRDRPAGPGGFNRSGRPDGSSRSGRSNGPNGPKGHKKTRRQKHDRGSFRLRHAMKLVLYSMSKCCFYCGRCFALKALTLDHKIPLGRGGSKLFDNVVLACQLCNEEKGCLTDVEYRALKVQNIMYGQPDSGQTGSE